DHEDRKHHEPEDDARRHTRRVHVGTRALDCLEHAAALQDAVEMDAPEQLVGSLLQQPGEEVSGEEDYEGAEERWDVVVELVETVLQAVAEAGRIHGWEIYGQPLGRAQRVLLHETGEIWCSAARGRARHVRGCAHRNNPASLVTGTGPDIDHPVASGNDTHVEINVLEIVLTRATNADEADEIVVGIAHSTGAGG